LNNGQGNCWSNFLWSAIMKLFINGELQGIKSYNMFNDILFKNLWKTWIHCWTFLFEHYLEEIILYRIFQLEASIKYKINMNYFFRALYQHFKFLPFYNVNTEFFYIYNYLIWIEIIESNKFPIAKRIHYTCGFIQQLVNLLINVSQMVIN